MSISKYKISYDLSILILLIIFIARPPKAFAQNNGRGWCGTIFKSEKAGCNSLSDGNSLGGSYPLLFDAFNINPSSIPTFETPLGVEAFMEDGKYNFSFIKGHGRIGSGLSYFSTDASFFSNTNNRDIMESFDQARTIVYSSANERFDPKLNYGNSINLFGSHSDAFISGSAGYNLKYNRNTQEVEKGIGIVLKTKFSNFSYSYVYEARNSILVNWTFGLRWGNFIYDYSQFENLAGVPNSTYIHSIFLRLGGFNFTFAYRRQTDPAMTVEVTDMYYQFGLIYERTHTLLGASYSFNDHIRVGYYSNYILGQGSSFVFQYIF